MGDTILAKERKKKLSPAPFLFGVRLQLSMWWRAGGVTGLYVPVHRTPVIERDNKNDEHAMIDREDGTIPADPVGIERHLFMAFEFLYQRLWFGFRSQLVQGVTNPAGFFYRQVEDIFLRPSGQVDRVHLYPMGIAEFVELPGLSGPDVGKSFLNCFESVFADGFPVDLGCHEPGDNLIIGLPRVSPEFC